MIKALLLACTLVQSISWTQITSPTTPPRFVGWSDIHPDPVSGQVWFYQGHDTMTSTVHVTNGSTAVSWVSGETFGLGWCKAVGDVFNLNGVSMTICGSLTDTHNLSLASPYGGSTANVTLIAASGSIYSTDTFFYKSSNQTFTYVGGNKTLSDDSSKLMFDTASIPGDRHPVGQNTLDTKRNWIWQTGGPHGTGSPQDPTHMMYLVLNSDPTLDTWHQAPVTMNHPGGTDDGQFVMRYDSDHDVILYWGGTSPGNQTSVYCYTQDNPIPGTATALQIAAGCANANDWTTIDAIGTGGTHCNVDSTKCPPTSSVIAGSQLVYDSVTHKYYQTSVNGSDIEMWTYDPITKTWAKLAPAHTPPAPQATGSGVIWSMFAINTALHRLFYHYQGATPSDWMYDPSASVPDWTQTTSGNGPIGWNGMTYDPASGKLIVYRQESGGSPIMWEGTFAEGSTLSGKISVGGKVTIQ